MPVTAETLRPLLQAFDFRKLFVQVLGWERHQAALLSVPVGGHTFTLEAVAHKRGFVAFICAPGPSDTVPDADVRRRIDREVTQAAAEHLVVFTDGRSRQVWQWVRRRQGDRPAACRTFEFRTGAVNNVLLDRLLDLRFTLDEEESVTQPEVVGRVGRTLDVDGVTKRFYDRFQKEHQTFLGFIEGIAGQGDRDWYASVMLNRLMFVYFVQRQGFLDGDRDYLKNRLKRVRQERGSGQFHTFYRHFLLRLFHEGLARPKAKRRAGLDALLGNVPYLNGGIFDPHELEQAHPNLNVGDEAFDRLFAFFDRYQWYLDDRTLANEWQINPGVIGYIFEKYVNQKQMGAYYTKEDITEYIARNTIVPYLLDAAADRCPDAFRADGVWRLLRDDPDRYLFDSQRHGADQALPPEVEAGRDSWNRPAPETHGLPTETWRESIARTKRHRELGNKLRAGEVCSVNDLITDNLDLRQFAEDVIDTCDDPVLLRAFWEALQKITVLDPTCGSGAFLFMALNILEPLYDACLDRMHALHWGSSSPEEVADFAASLEKMKGHPNRRFFILKSIIVNNLYGVDVMKEAVEICKLRLLLKVVAQARTFADLEPLPDMDFNVRVGNSLVGFASEEAFEKARQGRLSFDRAEVERIRAAAKGADVAFQSFRGFQTAEESDADAVGTAKAESRRSLDELRRQLNPYLAAEYGIDSSNEAAFAAWRASHQPFHWWSEFFGVTAAGGFDVIIGNPPYVEYAKVEKDYRIRHYLTEDCGNLYAFVVERSFDLLRPRGRSGMIVPHSAFCTDRMAPLMRLFGGPRATWVSTYDIRPSKLFAGVDQRLAIYLTAPAPRHQTFGTRYHRWHEPARATLFRTLSYADVSEVEYPNAVAKIGSETELRLRKMLRGRPPLVADLGGRATVYYHNAPRYWVRAMTIAPYFRNERDGEKLSTQVKTLAVCTATDAGTVAAALNSSLFCWWFVAFSDSRHLNRREIDCFPLGLAGMSDADRGELASLCARLMEDYRGHAVRKECLYKTTGRVVYDEYYPRHSKAIIDEIDRVLARHYGFSAEDLDFIINYDVKYRMGQDTADEAEEG